MPFNVFAPNQVGKEKKVRFAKGEDKDLPKSVEPNNEFWGAYRNGERAKQAAFGELLKYQRDSGEKPRIESDEWRKEDQIGTFIKKNLRFDKSNIDIETIRKSKHAKDIFIAHDKAARTKEADLDEETLYKTVANTIGYREVANNPELAQALLQTYLVRSAPALMLKALENDDAEDEKVINHGDTVDNREEDFADIDAIEENPNKIVQNTSLFGASIKKNWTQSE